MLSVIEINQVWRSTKTTAWCLVFAQPTAKEKHHNCSRSMSYQDGFWQKFVFGGVACMVPLPGTTKEKEGRRRKGKILDGERKGEKSF